MEKQIKDILNIVFFEDGDIAINKDAIRIIKENKEFFKSLLEGEDGE